MVMSIQMMMVSMGQRNRETTSRYFIVHLAMLMNGHYIVYMDICTSDVQPDRIVRQDMIRNENKI